VAYIIFVSAIVNGGALQTVNLWSVLELTTVERRMAETWMLCGAGQSLHTAAVARQPLAMPMMVESRYEIKALSKYLQ
jgi:hypothetical protein